LTLDPSRSIIAVLAGRKANRMDAHPPSRTRRTRHAVVVLLAGAIVGGALGAPAASGHYGLWHDDPAGDGGGFDVKGVRLVRKTEPLRGVVRVRTHEDIDLGGAPTVILNVDSRGDARPDRSVAATFDGASDGLLCLGVINLRNDRYVDDCRVRTDDRLWRITFRWRALDAERHVRWWIETSDGFDEPDDDDRAPDEGRFEH
jgi:hypothetical protein